MVVRFLANTVALILATWLLPGITLQSPETGAGVATMAVVAIIFGVANSVIKPLFRFHHTPVRLILLALTLLLANAALLLFTSWVCGLLNVGWRVDGFLSALIGGLIVSVVAFLMNSVLGTRGEEHR